jgi:hypothetical protein
MESEMIDDDGPVAFDIAVPKTEGGSTDVEMVRLIRGMHDPALIAAAVHELIWDRLPSELQTEAFRDRIMGPYHY